MFETTPVSKPSFFYAPILQPPFATAIFARFRDGEGCGGGSHSTQCLASDRVVRITDIRGSTVGRTRAV